MRAFLLLALSIVWAAPAHADSVARVSYVTSSTLYFDAGSTAGVAVGDTVTVWRGGERLGSLVVDYTSGQRATCSLEKVDFAPEAGDEVHYTSGTVVETRSPVRIEATAREEARWKGRIGLSFLGVRSREDYGQDFDQPAGELRLSGRRLFDGNWYLEVDARARRTYRRPIGGSSSTYSLNRVYRSSLEWRPRGAASSVVVGRQSSAELSNLSIFDGLSATMRRERWSLGLTGGTQPDREDFGLSGKVLEFGAFYRRLSAVESVTRWNLTLAGIASYQEGEIDREYLYLQGSLSDPRYMLFGSQELDLQRGWKKDYTGDTITPTATYLFGRYRFRRELGLHAGFDNRRRIRLWNDRETPETLFDESYRRGYWIGADSRIGRSWTFALDFRGSSGGTMGSAEVISLRARWFDLRRFPLQLGARLSRFGNDRYDGLLASLDLGWEATRRLRFDLEGGLRNEDHTGFVQDDTDQQWLRLNGELALREGWFLDLAGEWTRGGIDASDLYHAGVNYRF